MLEVKGLSVSVEEEQTLRGLDLKIDKGSVHAIMGPNGAGKSTLSKVICGHPDYSVLSGDILYKDQSILDWPVDKRALEGIFLSFQYPTEVPGVNNTYFLEAAYNNLRRYQKLPELSAPQFLKLIRTKMDEMQIPHSFLKRSLNEGFSGGEKKKNEVLQMSILEPSLMILDEVDSGLDVDALKVVAQGIQHLKSTNNSILIITHYYRILEYIVPDYVHILQNGSITKTGDASLALEIEQQGYS